ncbi:hypothetical protein [Candidatus Contendibacter odensensis]|nr:hypothetical protein [Candidatus Contendobacter odensis]
MADIATTATDLSIIKADSSPVTGERDEIDRPERHLYLPKHQST